MNEYMYNLDEIIKNSFKDTIEYLNNNGIKTEKLKLIIAKPPYLFFSRTYILHVSLISIFGFSLYKIISYMTHHKIPSLIAYPLIFSISILLTALELIDGTYFGSYYPATREIHIMEKPLRETIDDILDNLSFTKKIRPSIIGLQPAYSRLKYPVYINGNNIEKDIAKAFTDMIVAHEIGHDVLYSIIGSSDEWQASAFEFLVYFYKNELYNYPKAYKIIKRNIRTCKDYVENESPPSTEDKDLWASDLGICYACTIIDKNKWSSKVNIKDLIEEITYLYEEDAINIIKSYNIN
jgi:hypothetical protein